MDVTCQGHDYRLNGSSLPGYNAAAVYYTASEMIAMAGSAPIAGGQASGSAQPDGAVYNPETGGELPVELRQELISPAGVLTETQKDQAANSGLMWGVAAMALVLAGGLYIWHAKKER